MDSLKNYVNKEELAAIKNDYDFRCKNFYDKYQSILKEEIKKQIENCNLREMWMEKHWVFNCRFLSADIKILDPNYPENAFRAVYDFAKRCINELGGTLIDIRLDNQVDEYIILEVMVENPII